jgi:carbon monoxide dehydrogenase subunit G
MKTGQAEIDIKASADDVWAVIGQFDSIDVWMPGIDSCRVVGDDRIVGVGTMSITERLISRDDARRELAYSVVDGVPIEHHLATIRVTPVGDTSHVTWVVETTPDQMNDMMVKTYSGALEVLKAKVER